VNHDPAAAIAASQPSHATEQDDEISLLELGLVLWWRRRAVITTFVGVTALAVALALMMPKQYAYTTTIEIGTRVEDQKTVPIESPESALAKVADSYIPLARLGYRQRHADQTRRFEVDARVPKDSGLIVLEAKSKAADEPAYRDIQRQVVDALVADHERIFTVLRNGITLERQQAVRVLDDLKDGEQLLLADLKRLDLSAELLCQRIADVKALIEAATKNRLAAVREAWDEARAMTLLMLYNEVQQNRSRLAGLDEQLQVGLAQRRDGLNNKLRDNRREQGPQQAAIDRLDLRLQNIQDTRPVAIALRSVEPVSLSRSVISVLGLLLGAMLDLLVALALDFGDRLRATLGGASTAAVGGVKEAAV
jgi:hypothetical protein